MSYKWFSEAGAVGVRGRRAEAPSLENLRREARFHRHVEGDWGFPVAAWGSWGRWAASSSSSGLSQPAGTLVCRCSLQVHS